MTFPADGLSAAASSRHIATLTWNRNSGSDNDKGSSGFRGTFSRFPSALPSAFSRFLLRRGIGAPVHDTGSNATRDFSVQAGAFRRGDSFVPVCPSHFTHRDMAQRVSSSERLSTLPGHVAPGHLTAWGALLFPTLNGSSISTKGGATNSPHTSEIAAGRSIGPSRRPVTIHGGNAQKFIDTTLAALITSVSSDNHDRRNAMPRPVPLHGEVADTLIDFGAWERRALRDGRIDHQEALEGVSILRNLIENVRPMVATLEHVATCITGSQGMFSPRAIRGWNVAQNRPNNIVAFPVARDHAAGD